MPPLPRLRPRWPKISVATGDWRLARVGQRLASDEPPNAEIPPDIRMIVADRTIRAHSQCITFAWRYQRDRDAITLTADNPGPICGRGLSHWERAFERSVAAANRVELLDGHLVLRGTAGELAFIPAAPPSPIDLTGEWVLHRIDNDRVQDGGIPSEGIRLTITSDTMRAQSQCVAHWWRYRQSGQQLEMTPVDPGPVCDRTRTQWEQRFKHAIDGVNIGHRIDGRTLILAGSGGQAEFIRLD